MALAFVGWAFFIQGSLIFFSAAILSLLGSDAEGYDSLVLLAFISSLLFWEGSNRIERHLEKSKEKKGIGD